MNEQTKTLFTIILVGLSLLTLLAFQLKLTGPAGAHFFALTIGAFIFALILFALWIEEPWGYQLSTIFFSLALIDLIWMYVRTHDTVFGISALLLNAIGIGISTAGSRSGPFVETYDIDEDIRDLKAELESIRKARKTARRKN